MAYLGIGFTGTDDSFLQKFVEKHEEWLDGDRQPKFYGNGFIVLYDSNTAREFVKKCITAAPAGSLTVYPMSRPFEPASA